MPSDASGCAALEQSAKAKESTEKGEMAVVRRQAEDRQLTTRNGLVGGDNLESCPRVFTVNIFRAPESQVCAFECRSKVQQGTGKIVSLVDLSYPRS